MLYGKTETRVEPLEDTIDDLCAITKSELLKIRGVGPDTVKEIVAELFIVHHRYLSGERSIDALDSLSLDARFPDDSSIDVRAKLVEPRAKLRRALPRGR